MTAATGITRSPAHVKEALVTLFATHVEALLQGSPRVGRDLEKAVWAVLVEVGRALLQLCLSRACWEATCAEVGGVPERLRLDQDYWLGQMTTLGAVEVPLFAYRDAAGRTKAPAREAVFPLHPGCRSSELCVEWEARLGCQLPFRQAEDALAFFTHGAAPVEDTTLARHLVAVGGVLDHTWTFQAPETIRQTLHEHATRDQLTGRPLLYVSTDAHALRRYTDETWSASWKMINGLRLWCVDRRSGRVRHLGGAYTWGDCREVAALFETLARQGVLPKTGDYGDGVVAQAVLLTDGSEWIRTHVAPVMPRGTVRILDFYHAMEHVSDYAAARFGQGTKAARAWYETVRTQLLGKRRYRRPKATKRRGHRKTKRRARPARPTAHPSPNPHGAGEEFARQLIDDTVPEAHQDDQLALLHFVAENADRMDYPTYRARGMQVGSGAMESLHRIASQGRLKVAGARWLAHTALAVLNARMLLLAERWDEFWSHPDLSRTLATALNSNTSISAT